MTIYYKNNLKIFLQNHYFNINAYHYTHIHTQKQQVIIKSIQSERSESKIFYLLYKYFRPIFINLYITYTYLKDIKL